MSRGEGQIKEVGRFVRRVITENPSTKNRAVAEMVMAHFADRTFESVKLRQYIANVRYATKRQVTVNTTATGTQE